MAPKWCSVQGCNAERVELTICTHTEQYIRVSIPGDTPAASSPESMDAKPRSPSPAAEGGGDVTEEAKKLLCAGNRHLVMGDVVSAVSAFQDACAMLAERYGDTADECGEAFFLCGKALLELARIENTVLGNALEGVPEEDGDEGDKIDSARIESADNLDEEGEDSDEEGSTADTKESDEEVGNLQLAWEMLEVAKVIYKRKKDKEDQLMAAQTFLKLGEVCVESGNYSQALEDFQQCLELQLKYLPLHSRLLAETHYQLGVTSGYVCQHLQAVEHFSSSIKVIESRMALLQEVIDKADGADVAEEKKEMEELIRLLPDIKEKLEDAQEGQTTGGVTPEAIHQALAGPSTSGFPSSSSGISASAGGEKPSDGANAKPVSDISHLVRKKPEKQPAIFPKDHMIH